MDNKKFKQYRKLSYLALIMVAFLWGSSFAIMKEGLNHIGKFSLMMYRFSISSIILSIIFYKRLIKVTKYDVLRGMVMGLFMFLGFLFLIIGLEHTSPSKQAFVVGTNVIMVPFFACFINKRKIDMKDIIGVVIAVIGLYMLTMNSPEGFSKGDLYTLISAFFFAIHVTIIERFVTYTEPVVLSILQLITTSVLFAIVTGLTSGYTLDGLSEMMWPFIYLILVCTVICFVAQVVCQKYLSAPIVSVILMSEAAFSAVFSYFYIGEQLTFKMMLGGAIIFLSIIIQSTRKDNRIEGDSPQANS